MSKMDEELERSVWSRVREQEAQPALQPLAVAERSAAAMYLMLSRMMQGRKKELLRQLYHREQIHCRYLCGISVARNGKNLSIRTGAPEVTTAENSLRRCYASTLQAMAHYRARSQDPEYGHLFERLAREEAENCAMILEILGF